ncbi:hypothetical protein [Bacillus thuringiensis]|uniref:hypothetical protein n=1 Tax=Bacillus thuringiensis TaxID=1428 RepID=UPI0016429752|nr:hypothetical protein [Bacillus thuringiensis]
MLQELLDGYFIFLCLYPIFMFILAGIYYIKDRPRKKREREEYLREMGRLKD